MICKILHIVLLVGTMNSAMATIYYADANSGSDDYSGGIYSPFKTLAKCLSAIRSPGDACQLYGGVYDAGGVLTVSGTASAPIVIRAQPGKDVIIRQGAVPVWEQAQGNLWSTTLAYTNLLNAQKANSNYYERGIRLWMDGQPLTEACFPNLTTDGTGTHSTIQAQPGSSNTVLVNSSIPVGDLRGARAMAFPYLRQLVENRRVNSSGTGRVNINTGYYDMEVGNPFYLEGSKQLIDEDYEWAWDEPTGKVWIQMPARANPNLTKIRIQTSSTAFTLQAVSYVTIQNLRFEGVVPVATSGSVGVRYENLNINEAGILQFGEAAYDYTQLAGLVLRDGAVLTGSRINGCNGRCVHLAGSGITVTQNIIRNGTRMGQYEGAISIAGRNNMVLSNYVENSGRDGINFVALAVEGSIVRKNWIRNSGLQAWDAGGVTIGGHPNGIVTIDSNLIMGVHNEGSGIFLDEATQRNNINHNVIGEAMSAMTAQANLASNIYTSQNNSIWNNSVFNTVGSFMALREITNQWGTIYSNNITSVLPTVQSILTTSISSRASSPSEFMGKNAVWSGNLAAGISPMVTDIAKRDFRLQPGSPAIDIGLVGSWSYSGPRPDAGAVESGMQQWTYGVWTSSTLGCENITKWKKSPNMNGFSISPNTDRVEGAYSLQMNSFVNGSEIDVISAPISHAEVGGFGKFLFSMKYSEPSLGWGTIYLKCPSRGITWDAATLGDFGISDAPNVWHQYVLDIPPFLSDALSGGPFNDLTIEVCIRTAGGIYKMDDIQFRP